MNLENIANRLFKSWQTTLVGLGFGAFSIYALHTNKVDWNTWMVMMGAAFAFLFTKESKQKDKLSA